MVDEDNLGFVKLFRKMKTWEWYTDVPVKTLFIHCVLSARHYPKNWKGLFLEQGQFPTGISKLSVETGLSFQEIRTALVKLESTNEITYEATSRGTIITVVNYSVYHSEEDDSNTDDNKQATNEQQTGNKQATTLKKEKKVKKVKKVKNKDLYLDFVKLTKDEHEKLIKKFGKEGADKRIWNLNDYGHRKKKKFNEYTDHYRTILNWDRRENNGKNTSSVKRKPVEKAKRKSESKDIGRKGLPTVITIED